MVSKVRASAVGQIEFELRNSGGFMQWIPVALAIIAGINGLFALANTSAEGRTRLRSWLGVSLSFAIQFLLPLTMILFACLAIKQFADTPGVANRKEIVWVIVDVVMVTAGVYMSMHLIEFWAKRHHESRDAELESQRERLAEWEAKDRDASRDRKLGVTAAVQIGAIGKSED